ASIEGLTLEELHHQEGSAIVGHTEVEDVDRVSGLEVCGDLSLRQETTARALARGRGPLQELDGDRGFERHMARPPHFSHPTPADWGFENVAIPDKPVGTERR